MGGGTSKIGPAVEFDIGIENIVTYRTTKKQEHVHTLCGIALRYHAGHWCFYRAVHDGRRSHLRVHKVLVSTASKHLW